MSNQLPNNPYQSNQTSNPVNPYANTPYGNAPYQGPEIPNYLVQSILVTVFCCIPLGIVALVFSVQVNSKLKEGDYQGALECSSKAKTFVWVSFILGLLANLAVMAFYALLIIGAIIEAQSNR